MQVRPLLATLAVAALAGCGGGPSPAATGAAAPATPVVTAAATPAAPTAAGSTATPAGSTPAAPPVACDGLVATPAQAEGPYFTPGSPERAYLRDPGLAGTTLVVTGRVVDTACAPIPGARIDVWQADAGGVYDNEGYRLRGHLFSAADGSYRFTTIVPGQYPGRTEHVHVKVTPPGGATLTTQLYFPGSEANAGDGIFARELLLDVTGAQDELAGTFTFVLPAP